MVARTTNLLDSLSDDDFFKSFAAQALSNAIIVEIDRVITDKTLTYTQKQQLANLRDSGILNEIMLGNFSRVSISKLIEIFSIFNLGIGFYTVPKEILAQNNVTEIH